MNVDWDYIVVGGGSAGCAIAARLSEDRETRVLLVEAGEWDWYPFIHVPGLLLRAMKRRGILWNVIGERDSSRNGATTFNLGGRVLGGSSAINGIVWVRGNHGDFDCWAERGATGWDSASVGPYFERAETFEHAAPDRGRTGPVHVETIRAAHPLTIAFVESAKAVGHPYTDDYNGPDQGGVGFGQSNTRRGFRHTSARAYLGGAWRRRNLRIRTKATTTRIMFEGTRAVGVVYEHSGKLHEARARREVIVSAGAIGSPKLLLLSGVGPADHLRELGIDVVADSPNVGRNLQEHPVVTMQWQARVPTYNLDWNLAGVVRHGVKFVLQGRGPAAASVFHAVVFGRFDASSTLPDFQLGFQPLAMGHQIQRDIARMRFLELPGVSVIVTFLHPRSRGRVLLRSADPVEPAIVELRLLDEAKDFDGLKNACVAAREIMAAPPISGQLVGEYLPGPEISSDDEWEQYLRSEKSYGGQHVLGTCAMGSDPASVTDPELRVRGVSGLRVVDASVMPALPSGNTNAPTIMIAEKAADLVRAARS
jgi:choline dehydrogenase